LAQPAGYRNVKCLDLGVNIVAVERELVGHVNQLRGNDPADAPRQHHSDHDGRQDGHDSARAQLLEKRHYGGQQECQRQGKRERN
jgi:hypothetical protein